MMQAFYQHTQEAQHGIPIQPDPPEPRFRMVRSANHSGRSHSLYLGHDAYLYLGCPTGIRIDYNIEGTTSGQQRTISGTFTLRADETSDIRATQLKPTTGVTLYARDFLDESGLSLYHAAARLVWYLHPVHAATPILEGSIADLQILPARLKEFKRRDVLKTAAPEAARTEAPAVRDEQAEALNAVEVIYAALDKLREIQTHTVTSPAAREFLRESLTEFDSQVAALRKLIAALDEYDATVSRRAKR